MIVHFFVALAPKIATGPRFHHKQVGLETTSIQKQVGIVVLQTCFILQIKFYSPTA